jgi:hypothetical protein
MDKQLRHPRYTPEYWAWRDMKKRCFLPKNKYFHNYGGRGITVCDEWVNDFDQFVDDVGYRPSPAHSLDRIDNNGDYRPGNVSWSTKDQQDNNRRTCVFIEFQGMRKNYKQWSKHYGVRPDKFRYYILRGLNPEQAAIHCKQPPTPAK